MSFSSASFFLLLFVTLAAYRYAPLYAKKVFLASPAVARNIVILAASAVFYAFAGVRYLPLLGAAAFVSFSSGLALARMEQPRLRKALLAAALCLLFGSLCFFKYGGLFGTARAMPLGISFYTFALAGYLIDQYRRKYAPEPDFLRFAGFACFFPLIASGPIERGDGLLSQMAEPPQPRYGMFCEGASRMLWGFFKKFVVADTIGVTVGRVFADIPAFSGPYLLLAALLYSYELYCDFSGYSDIAIGAARLFGFSVRENFMRPFAARSFGELWRRWHISLTSWLREYIYFPLGGSRKGMARTVCNILMIFFISGIWHGAGATFAVWGLLNGILMIFGRFTAPLKKRWEGKHPLARCPKVRAAWQIVCVYLQFSACAVFFRAASLPDACALYARLFTGWGALLHPSGVVDTLRGINIGRVSGLLILGGAVLIEWVEWRAARQGVSVGAWTRTLGKGRRMALYYALVLAVLVFGALGSSSFIYFAF